MVLLGVLVTQTGSGQGCGRSWPLCHGQLLPDTITIAGLYEYSHRIMSSVDGFLIVVLTVGTWLLYRRDSRAKILSFLSLFFVILQGVLGALTVMFEGTFELSTLLSVHFGFALISFSSVILLTVHLFQVKDRKQDSQTATAQASPVTKRLQYIIWGITTYTYVVVYTGALVSHRGAVLGCGQQFPTCGSIYFPSFASLAGVQMLHRFAAGLIWLFVLGLAIAITRTSQKRRDVVRGSWWAFILVTLQAFSGLLNIFTEGQLLADLLHTILIVLFFTVLCYLCMQVGWPWKRSETEQVAVATSTPLEAVHK
jgi:cytochrome c oxidase assembly protein subunit 15